MTQLQVNDCFSPPTDRAFLQRVVTAALADVQRQDMPVSLLLADDETIAQLHADYCDDPSPTDVLSFAMDDGVEVAVSVECAHRVATRHGHSTRAEIALYVVHGILHVCGYDDLEPDERARMREAEVRILQSIGERVAPVDR